MLPPTGLRDFRPPCLDAFRARRRGSARHLSRRARFVPVRQRVVVARADAPGQSWNDDKRKSFEPVSRAPAATAVLDFEKPLVELDRRIHEVRKVAEDNGVDVTDQIGELDQRAVQLRQDTYSRLTPQQRLQVARHPSRPTFLDIVFNIADDGGFAELHGDRAGLDDPAVVAGIARVDGTPFLMVGQQKGRNTKENIYRNFAMPQPNGYRKALRFFDLADKMGIPVLTFIDTPGAFAGKDAEEKGQGEAIARNLREMFSLKVPVISIVIGEGGSGGALAIGVANSNLILENAVYYVASPEACAAILWKNRDDVATATEALRITSTDLCGFGIMDRIIPEPLGGAHRNPNAAFPLIKDTIMEEYRKYEHMNTHELKADRYNRYRGLGDYREFVVSGGKWDEAEARREAAEGMMTESGRWAEDESEAAYWDRHDTLTKQWAELLESDDGVQYAMAPAAVSHSLLKRPDSAMTSKLSQRADDEANPSAAKRAAQAAGVGSNGA